MPLISTQPKNPLSQTTTPPLKTLAVDDYFFRGLAEDLKRMASGKAIRPKPLATIPTPAPVAPVKKPEPRPGLKTIKPKTPIESEKQKQAAALLAAKKGRELAKIEQQRKEQLLKITQKQAKVIFKQAKRAYRQKNLEQTVSLCQACLKLKPDFNRAKKYLNKAQQKLGQLQKETEVSLQEKQKEAMAEALKRAKASGEVKLREDLKIARIRAQAEIQAQMQQLTSQIQGLEQQYQKVSQQQEQERLKLQRAQEEKIKIEARLKAEEQIQAQLQQQALKQISDIKTEVGQEAAPQLLKLKQQLSEQEQILKTAQEQRVALEKQREQIQRLSQEQESQLAKLKTQEIETRPQPLVSPAPPPLPAKPEQAGPVITPPRPRPPFEKPTMPAPKPMTPLPPTILPKPTIPAAPVVPPRPILPTAPPPLPKPVAVIPKAQPRPIVRTKPRKALFSIKNIAIALGSLLVISILGLIIYWRFALKPTPPPPPLPASKQPELIIKIQKPATALSSWQKALETIIPYIIKLPLKNAFLDAQSQFDSWLGQRIFYLDFTGQPDKSQLTGVFVLELSDKTEAEKTMEKIKTRQASPVSLENYHQYNIVSCQEQKWVFVDLFNLHYLIFSQDSQNLKTVLDLINQEELAFLESLEDKTNFWPGLAGTAINIWLNPELAAFSLKPLLAQIDLKIPLEVTIGLKNYFTMILLDEPATNNTSQIRTAVLLGFDDFDQVNQAMLAWEKTMSHEVAFLFWGLKPTSPTTLNFQGALYQNAIIRFLKMPDEGLGIYYGLTKSNLVLTNSEKNVKLLIDYFNQ